MTKSEYSLTPSEELVLEVLVARHRLGETLWTFDARLTKQIESLADLGYVMPMNGVVEKTVRASLTPVGIKILVSESTFVPQGFKLHADEIAAFMDETGFEPNVGRVIRKKFGLNS